MTKESFNPSAFREQSVAGPFFYNCPVVAVLPHSDDLMALASGGIFALRYPDHPVTALYKQAAARLVT
jgi:hypothetical protein